RQHSGAVALRLRRRQLFGGPDDGAPDLLPCLAQPAVELLRDRPTSRFHLPLLCSGGSTPAAAHRRPGLEVLEDLSPRLTIIWRLLHSRRLHADCPRRRGVNAPFTSPQLASR